MRHYNSSERSRALEYRLNMENSLYLWGVILQVGSYGPYCRLLELTGIRLLPSPPSDLLSLPLAS